jgi:uncharacterized membrane protein YhdT
MKETLGVPLPSTLQHRPSPASRWLLSVTCYLVPLLLAVYVATHFQEMNDHPRQWFIALVALAAPLGSLFNSSAALAELALVDGKLRFTTLGRPPVLFFGPKAKVITVPADAPIKWTKSMLILQPEPGGPKVGVALPSGLSRSQLAAWFDAQRLLRPKGLESNASGKG